MSIGSDGGGRPRSLILAAMIFAVAMTFIDQTIVSIAAPTIQADLGLSSSGMQWAIRADFAAAIRDVLFTMCAIMAVAGFVALRGLRRGVQEDTEVAQAGRENQRPGDEPDAAYPTFR
jgi:MFS family permease